MLRGRDPRLKQLHSGRGAHFLSISIHIEHKAPRKCGCFLPIANNDAIPRPNTYRPFKTQLGQSVLARLDELAGR